MHDAFMAYMASLGKRVVSEARKLRSSVNANVAA